MTVPTDETSERMMRTGQLLAQAGFGGSFALVPLQGGANSKAFRVDLSSPNAPLFLKEYFHHPDDPRDRLGTEFAFASFAWQHGLRMLAQPHVMNRETHSALYGFLDGRKLAPVEIGRSLIEACLHFLQALNARKTSARQANLPIASEACFCLNDHWQCLIRRIKRFEVISPAADVDREALDFVREELAPACFAYLTSARELAAVLRIEPDAMIADVDRCLSPSDFGFHNALLSSTGTLSFLDFEYAGWDDPAKTVCDFFCQPACPAPLEYYPNFAVQVAAMTSDPGLHRNRFDLLLPMYRLKWCCIMLNDFLPSGGSRRRFAIHNLDETTRKTNQLHKARQALDRFWDERLTDLAA